MATDLRPTKAHPDPDGFLTPVVLSLRTALEHIRQAYSAREVFLLALSRESGEVDDRQES